VIMLTGTGSEEIAVQSLKSGAADYVLKTVKGIRRLGFTIRNVLADLQIRRELAFKNAVLENLLETTRVRDPATLALTTRARSDGAGRTLATFDAEGERTRSDYDADSGLL